jgi:hypothetical protein
MNATPPSSSGPSSSGPSNRKAELLSRTVEHVAIDQYDARPVIDAMRNMSFTSRDTARAADILSMALEDQDCSTWLTLAGSTSAGGCMHIYRDMVKYGMIDAVVATGASIIDMDFFEALGFKHYQAQGPVDDRDLRALYIDRIYDTYIDEEDLQSCDHMILEIANSLEPRPYSSREFIYEMGKWLADGNAKKEGSMIETAYREGVPIFCPAFTDSSAGFGLVKHQVERLDRRLPRADRDQAGGRHHGPVHGRRRRAEELRAGHGGLRRDPRPRGGHAQVRHPDHCGRRARRRLLVLDAPGSLLVGQGRRDLGADGVRRGHHRGPADRLRRLAPRLVEDPRAPPLEQAVRQGGVVLSSPVAKTTGEEN